MRYPVVAMLIITSVFLSIAFVLDKEKATEDLYAPYTETAPPMDVPLLSPRTYEPGVYEGVVVLEDDGRLKGVLQKPDNEDLPCFQDGLPTDFTFKDSMLTVNGQEYRMTGCVK